MSFKRLAAAAFIVVLAVACNSTVQAPAPEIIIASDFPSIAEAVPAMQNAIQLAVAENPKLRGYRLGYLPFDDSLGGAPWTQKGMQNLKSMFADPKVLGMVGPFNSYVTIEEIPRASAENFVMLSPTATNICLTLAPFCDSQIEAAHANAPVNFFRIAPPDPAQGTAMAHFAGQQHIKLVAAINMWNTSTQSGGDEYIAEFARELRFQGGDLVRTEESRNPNHDFTNFLTHAKQAGAEAIYAVGDVAGGICDIRAQMRSDFKYLLLTDGATTDSDCLKSPASVATFGTAGSVDATLSSDPHVKSIVKAFQKAYPRAPIGDYTFAAYDCAQILIAAIGRAIDANHGGVPTRLEVLKQVASGEFDGGATGSYKFLPSGDAVSPTMSIWGVKDNHWYYIDKVDASASS